MKSLHFCFALITSIVTLSSTSVVTADDVIRLLPASPVFGQHSGRHASDIIFRAQGGVPLPPEAGVPATGVSGAPAAQAAPAGQAPIVNPPVSQPLGPGSLTTPAPSTWNAFSPPVYTDPFANGMPPAAPVAPYGPYAPYGPFGGPGFGAPGYGAPGYGGGFSVPGVNGPRPYRMGWHSDLDLEWMPNSGVAGATGGFEQFGVDYDLGYTGLFMPGWIMTWTNQFRLRNWDGPNSGPGLPGKAFRFGWDFQLETPQSGPVGIQLGITPSINSDLDGSVGSAAFQLDGRGAFLFQLDQRWSLVLGAQYWDRVEDRVIPHVGVIYRDDWWEWRLMYPESMVSLFLGNEAQWSKWLYARAEYHVEAYEVRTAGGGRDQAQLDDWRVLIGFRMDAGTYSWFTEAGWVFDREVEYGIPANGSFSPNTGFIARLGWKY
ncbi:MAG: hypothetical protein NXI04_26355 [Planctomycetaceae bacterium]|nr:hypothetical protein [Planctomycetaceae bacterium]